MSRRQVVALVTASVVFALLVSFAVGANPNPDPNGAGWHNSPFSVDYGDNAGDLCIPATDSYSGGDTGGATLGPSACTDSEGLNPYVDSYDFRYDNTNPTITGSRTPGPNGAGWNNTAVTANFDCSDALSGGVGPGECPSQTFSGTGAGQSVTRTVTDAAGNSASATVGGINIDTSPPTITPSRPAANSFGWYNQPVTVTFTCDAAPSGVATCGPNATLSTQGAGQAVSGSATDNAGNGPVAASSTGINIDTTAPVLNVPNVPPVEATGPTGAVANITAPTATDNLAAGGTAPGPVPVMCNRSLTTAFPLGTTTVNCTAADGHGLSTPRSFNVIVRDTTPPTLPANLPTRLEIYENADGGASRSHPTIAELLAVRGTDIVDTDVTMTNNAPAVFPLEQNTSLTLTATDNFGNAATRTVTIFVRRIPPGANPNAAQFRPPSLDLAAPRNPRQLRVTAGDHTVTLNWQASTSADVSGYVVTREIVPKAARTPQGAQTVVYRGPNTSFKDRRLKNGVQYRYLVASEDTAGNRSAGVAVVAVPSPIRLVAPKDGAQIRTRKVKFRWAPVPKAAYYNLQLFRVSGKKEIKILSIWPAKASFTLNKSWKFNGRTQTLFADDYRWYVFPGFGKRSEVRYGAALGSNIFEIPKAKAAPARTSARPPAMTAKPPSLP